jgi:hypothetical protein
MRLLKAPELMIDNCFQGLNVDIFFVSNSTYAPGNKIKRNNPDPCKGIP